MPKRDNVKLKNFSPLRYPGGKAKLYPLVSLLINKSMIENAIYIEPFAGGAGVALSLLYNNVVDEIVINDYDKAIYSMWRAMLTQTTRFIELINNTPITVEEWRNQKNVYLNQNARYSLELGFAAFYLNRTNRSGILTAGPIGGYDQTGAYKINARFNKKDLINRIRKLASYKNKIHIYNHDVRAFITSYATRYMDRAFIYFDPPYYNKGKTLYKNFFNNHDHQDIHDLLQNIHCPWIVTYDNAKEIKKIYEDYTCWQYDLVYGVANSGKSSEIMYVSDNGLLPNEEERKDMKINFRVSD